MHGPVTGTPPDVCPFPRGDSWGNAHRAVKKPPGRAMVSTHGGPDNEPMGGAPRSRSVRARLRRLGVRLRAILAPSEVQPITDRRFMVIGYRVRLATVVAAMVAIPFYSSDHGTDRLTILGLFVLALLPYALVGGRLGVSHSGWGARIVLMVGDTLATFTFSIVVPEGRVVALLVYLLVVAFHTSVGGLRFGGAVIALAVPLAVVAEAVASEPLVATGYSLVMFAAAAVILAGIVEASTRERRRSARFLTRLQRAISEVPAAPDLSDTLDSVCRAARRAVDAKFASVLVRDHDEVVQGALEGDHHPDPAERSSEIIRRILDEPMRSPSGVALTTGERVVVPVIAEDERFNHWTDETRRQSFTSTIAVPLRTGNDVVGVLAAYFPSPVLVTDETADLLTAYAEHSTLVILRALAFEHEKNAARRLSEADAIKSELVATVSHELRTPLTAVKGFVETVVRHWERFDDDQRREMLERALGNADQLATMIDTVLDFSRIEAGMVDVATEPLALEREVAAVVDASDHLIGEHPVLLDLEEGLVARGDRTGLGHVLTNLLSNAAKYSDADAPIRVSTRRRDGDAVISIADAGPGIAPDEQERIFDRFYRGQPGEGPRGTGVGLAVVRRYADLMGGVVEVESEVGRGSTFSLVLPTTTAEPTDERVSAPSVAR